MSAKKRNTSRDGFRNKVESFVLTGFKPFWSLVQCNAWLNKMANRILVNSAIAKIPVRPLPFSTRSPYTSWASLTQRAHTGMHLPPTDWKPLASGSIMGLYLKPADAFVQNLPPVESLGVLFRQDGPTRYSEKSTLLLPYFVQWFTDSFIRSDRENPLRNSSNHEIDLCNIYGLTPAITAMLRSGKGGKLKSQVLNGEEYPPFYHDEDGNPKAEFKGMPHMPGEGGGYRADSLPLEKKRRLFAMGLEVERVNVQVGYVMMNVLWLREHNRLCGLLATEYPAWDDERIFQTARNISVVEMINIIVEDYINHVHPYQFRFISDPLAFSDAPWNRPNWMSVEFALVYRWHSMLPPTLVHQGREMPTPGSMWNNEMIIEKGLGAMFEEVSSQRAARVGLFNTPDFLVPTELASIRLGRLAKLRSYNDYRELCKFPRVTDFDQISENPRVQQELKRLYGHVDHIELYVGLYAEDARPGSALPSLVARLVGVDGFSQIFTNPLMQKNIYNEETFSPLGWAEIQNTRKLSQVVNRNGPGDRHYAVSFNQDHSAR